MSYDSSRSEPNRRQVGRAKDFEGFMRKRMKVRWRDAGDFYLPPANQKTPLQKFAEALDDPDYDFDQCPDDIRILKLEPKPPARYSFRVDVGNWP